MPKKRYLYANKKVLKEGRNQQEEDYFYFCSPEYAKQIGKKFGLNGKAVEVAFRQYFEAMKYLGITQLVNKDRIRRRIDKFEFNFWSSFGRDKRFIAASTNIKDFSIDLRNSFKTGDSEVLFHEFNHLLAQHNSNGDNWLYDKREKIFSTGFDIANITEDEIFLTLFNEGVTELLACLQDSYYKKTVTPIAVYEIETGLANSLYMICGNALFDGYFNGGNFEPIARAIGEPQEHDALAAEAVSNIDTDADSLAFLADDISFIQEMDYVEAYQTFKYVQIKLINILYKKVFLDVVNNLDKFNNSSEIDASVFTAFANYSKTIFFGRNKYTVFNLATRDDVFNHLTQTYFDLLNNVEVVIQERRDLPFAYQEPKISFEEVRDEFIYINDCSYGLIDYRQKPINVMAKDYTIQVFEPNKGNYLRKKIGYDDVYDMKGSIMGERLKEALEEAVAAYEGGEDDYSF